MNAMIADSSAVPEHVVRDCIRFEIGPREKVGLRKYGELLAKHGLIPAPPKRLSWV